MTLLDFLDERKSVRIFDPKAQISNREIMDILAHASDAPSGNNFQPWKVFVVKNKEKQAILKNFSFNQQQVADASAIFLIFGNKSNYDIQKIMKFNLENCIISESQLIEKTNRVRTYLKLHPEDISNEGLRFDNGLFAMNLMHIIRAFGYESNPMRGTDFQKIMEFLNIPQNLVPILMLPIGKPLKAGYPHQRYPINDFVKIIE
ncbi:nitroreductase family protein [Lactococcus taiwanensis]|uniref:nitroreductase family protein n=1 Tax=Lactococcus taiwanensis TaxID=1151742 RepID=UPI00351979AE